MPDRHFEKHTHFHVHADGVIHAHGHHHADHEHDHEHEFQVSELTRHNAKHVLVGGTLNMQRIRESAFFARARKAI